LFEGNRNRTMGPMGYGHLQVGDGMENFFIFVAYVLGTGFGYYWGKGSGRLKGIEDCVDNLIEQGYLKYRGTKRDPDLIKHDEKY